MPTMGAARPRKKFRSNSFRSVEFRTPRNDEHRALQISGALDHSTSIRVCAAHRIFVHLEKPNASNVQFRLLIYSR